MKNNLIYEYFSDDDLLRISNKIKETEALTSGEIRVSIKERKNILQRKKSTRELAQQEFYRLKMNETADKTGIIIFIVLIERNFQILADEGINVKVPDHTWENISNQMQEKFRNGYFCEGVLNGIDSIGKILSEYFPIKQGDTNELSNKVVF